MLASLVGVMHILFAKRSCHFRLFSFCLCVSLCSTEKILFHQFGGLSRISNLFRKMLESPFFGAMHPVAPLWWPRGLRHTILFQIGKDPRTESFSVMWEKGPGKSHGNQATPCPDQGKKPWKWQSTSWLLGHSVSRLSENNLDYKKPPL